MTDSPDIVALLKDACRDWDGSEMADGAETRVTMSCGEMRAAVAEIESLRVESAELRDGKRAILPQTREHAENLYAVAVACLKSFGSDPEAALSASLEREKQLREALEPFARVIEIMDSAPIPRVDDADGARAWLPGAWPTIGDFRRARTALNHKDKG